MKIILFFGMVFSKKEKPDDYDCYTPISGQAAYTGGNRYTPPKKSRTQDLNDGESNNYCSGYN